MRKKHVERRRKQAQRIVVERSAESSITETSESQVAEMEVLFASAIASARSRIAEMDDSLRQAKNALLARQRDL